VVNFVVGSADPAAAEALRGVVFRVATEWDALEMFRELKTMALRARAEARESEFLDALDTRCDGAREDPSGTDPLFSTFVAEWLEVRVDGRDLSESEVESTRSIVRNHLLPFFGRMRLSQIGMRQLDRYVALKRKQKHQYGVGYGASSINNHLSVLRRCLKSAVRYEMLPKNPVTEDAWQRRDRVAEDSDNWLEPDEERQVVAWLREHWRQRPGRWLPLLTQLVAGLRFSELRALQVKDLVQVPRPGLWVRRSQARSKVGTPKNKHARFQMLPSEVMAALLEVASGEPGELLFPGPKGGALANNSLNRWLRHACREAGVREVTSHGLRHTAGTSYAAMGYSQRAIAALLGHRDTKSTERYTHTADRLKADAVAERWSKVVRLDAVRQRRQGQEDG